MIKRTIALTSLIILLSLTIGACSSTAVDVESSNQSAAVVEEPAQPVVDVEEPATAQEEAAAEVEEPVSDEEEPSQETAGSATAEEHTDSIMALLSALEGLWTMTYPYDPQCTETINFNTDMTFAIDAGEEHIEGMYGLDEEINESGRARFFLIFTSDNGGADCSGRTSDDTGMGGEFYLALLGPSDLQFFMQPSGGEPVITYTR